jgi:hypothetical protein
LRLGRVEVAVDVEGRLLGPFGHVDTPDVVKHANSNVGAVVHPVEIVESEHFLGIQEVFLSPALLVHVGGAGIFYLVPFVCSR